MLIKSKINGRRWLWINIPKTATTTTLKAIFPERDYRDQSHHTFKSLKEEYKNKYDDVFTMVRHPLDRFMSGLNHIFSVCECGQCKFDLKEPPTTEEVIAFLRDMLLLKTEHENFFDTVYNNKENDLYAEVINSIQKNFKRNITINNNTCVRWPLIIPQSYILDGLDNAKIFRYENINTFFNFVTYKLGYTIPTEKYRNYSNKLINVDTSNTTLRQFLYEFHKNDFVNYNYSI